MRIRGSAAAGLVISLAMLMGACGGESEFTPFTTTAAPVATTAPAGPTTTTAAVATSTEPPAAATTTSVPPVEPAIPAALVLVAQEGWVVAEGGMVVAENSEDLVGSAPVGARVVDVTSPEMEGFVPESDPAATELTGEPVELTVAGFPAVGLTLTEALPSGVALATTTLVVDTGGGTVQVFLLQAPAAGYPDVEATLLAAVQPAS